MRRLIIAAAAASLLAGSVGAGAASAQPYGHGQDRRDDRHDQRSDQRPGWNNDHGQRHHNWRRGGRIDRGDWSRGQRVDWRSRHLRRPPRGYEWREVDGNYVMAAVATGVIASIIANSR